MTGIELNVEAAHRMLDDLAAYRKALKALLHQIDEWESNHESGDFSSSDPGCIQCTRGVTPDKYNTGLCAYHQAKQEARE